MARYRQVETAFWMDGFVLKLTPEEKYFYLYLLTNPHTTQCGIYELPERMAEVETGYNRETITKLRDRFCNKYKKIKYSESTEEYCIVNWLKFNSLKSPKVKACIDKELSEVKNRSLIDYLYSMDRPSIDSGEEEEKEEEEEEEEEEKKKDLSVGVQIEKSDFSDEMKLKLKEWVKYKSEKRDSYKPTGFASLLTSIKNKVDKYGESAVINLINDCMANNWRGIIWDKIKNNKPGKDTDWNFTDLEV